MSKQITCRECGFGNPHSSKFCNNCGAKLPLSTHIICPNCETPNTRDRVFCDSCGTRLISETTQLKPEEPKVNPAPPSEPFSLPTRRPGDTGELNPNAVPDWLRTGNINANKLDDDDDDDTADEKKGASDLPEWLVHDSDPEPIINAPTTISTEFYQDLLDKAEDLPQPDDLFADEEDTNLPDWLSDVTDANEVADVRTGLTDWLSDLQDEDDAGETAVTDNESAAAEEDVSSGLTDWLQELDDLNNLSGEEDAAELPDETAATGDDWLQELGPAQTDLFPGQEDQPAEPDAEDLPAWMNELGPLQTNLLNPDQIAQLTGPLGGLAEDDLVDDEEAGAEASFTDLFETSAGLTETLPDWLDAAAEEGEIFLDDTLDELDSVFAREADSAEPDEVENVDDAGVVDEADSDWFTLDQFVAETDLDWLEETGNLEQLADEDALELPTALEPGTEEAFDFADFDLMDEDASTAEPAEFADADAEAELDLAEFEADDDFDWLADMEAIQTGQLEIEPDLELDPAPEETAVPTEPQLIADEPEPEPDDDTWNSDTLFAETAVSEDLPDWLERLDETGEETAGSEAPNPEGEELPDWIASMRPGQGIIGSELPGVFSEIDLRDTLEGIPEELAGAELPDWLHDAPIESMSNAPAPAVNKEAPLEIPDWLQPGAGESDQADAPASSEPLEPPASSRNEWRSLLDELPPLTPLAESLPKAEIPEWVQQLKPPELTGELPRELEGPEETAGPLKGMQGVVAIEPAIARPRVATLPTPYVTTPEQRQQVALLQQLTHEMPETVTTLSAKSAYDTAVWLRLTLTLLVLGALLVGLLGPSVVATTAAVPTRVQAVETAVTAAAGQPVLLAIEYTPALAGELSPQAEMLINQLAANNSPVLVMSQYAAGTAVAANLTAENDVQYIGYLPGEGIGLRQLGDCLGGRNNCAQLNGRQLDNDLQTALSQTGLVILLTGDRDNLVNWIEQVSAVAPDVPLVAGVTQALTPLANSYATTGQLDGLLGGVPDAAAYERLVDLPDSVAQTQLNAQIYAQLVAAVLLFIGLLTFGSRGVLHNRRQKKQDEISVQQR